MSSKEFVKKCEPQLRLEQTKRMHNKTWFNNVMNVLIGKNVCGACLHLENDLVHWDAEFVLCSEIDIDSLKNIMISTFGPNVTSIIPTPNFCQKCVDTILNAHFFILQLRDNCKNIQGKLIEISQQMKWTAYLDDTGSLTETMLNNKVIHDYNLISDHKINVNPIQKEVITHTIILDNDSLKHTLLKDADMHKFLITKVKVSEPKLSEEITVKKVSKSIDMTDFTPQDLLELDWAEDGGDTEISNKLSNKAVTMSLMEEAKTVEKHKHFQDNLNLQVKTTQHDALHDSLSAKLIQEEETPEGHNDNMSDTDDLVPQDLLELKWPDEPNNTQTKIPVKKLNFNENLTVKFIPAHKLVRVNDNVKISQELLDQEVTNKSGQKHSIDLTKWLNEQGMSTIKAQNQPDNSLQDFDIEAHISKKVRLDKHNETEEIIHSVSGTKATRCNIAVKSLDLLKDPDNSANAIRCGICGLSFILYKSYWSHYKTHSTTDIAKCYRCSGKFPVIELLVEHLLLAHYENISYCTLCYALLGQDKLARHMVDHHAQKVEIINASSTMPLITIDGRCKKCNQPAVTTPDTPHICVFNFECTECTKGCVHKRYINSYIDQIRNNKTVYKCADCEYMYKTKQDIIKHANYMHLQHKSHQCVVCNLRFSTQNELVKHNNSSHFTCRGCKKVFSENALLYEHNCPKALIDALSCGACGQRFSNENSYIKHKETALAVGITCILCLNMVSNACNMSRHMQVKHQVYLKKDDDKIIYECTICYKVFDTETNFKQHSCLYECMICERRFINKVLYERHMLAHSGIKNVKRAKQKFKCSICNLELVDKYAYTNHMITHPNYAKCPICLEYIGKSDLTHHIESHDGVSNSFKCPHCVLVCENRNQYEIHVNRFHLMRRPYQCDYCQKAFYGKQKLVDHIKHHVSERRKAKCPVCGTSFATKVDMEKHLHLHSAGKLHHCDLCEKMYISAALLDKHRKSHTENDLAQPETSQSSQM